MLVTGAHGSITTSAAGSFLIEFAFHGSSIGCFGLLPPPSQGSAVTAAFDCCLDNHGSVVVASDDDGGGPVILSFDSIHSSDDCVGDGECVPDSQPSTFE